MKELLAVTRVNKVICADYRMVTGKPATNQVALNVLEEAQSATGYGIDRTILKNDAGTIKESQIKKAQKTIFERNEKRNGYGTYCKLPGLGHA
jgi:hypothetical protein